MAGDRTTVLQDEGDRFALEHGTVGLHGVAERPALRHDLDGHVVHGTAQGHPLVHMVCWAEEPCAVEVSGRLAITGDPEEPLVVRMRHEFATDHHQTLAIEPVDHTLQMRTPLELRFCNPWHIASDYRIEMTVGGNRILGIQLTGATIATPQPCEEPRPP